MQETDTLRDARTYLLGWCHGDRDLCDALWSVLHDDLTLEAAADAVGVNKSTICRKVAAIRADDGFRHLVREAHDVTKQEAMAGD